MSASKAVESPYLDDARQAAWRMARRILAVRLDNLGDVLMTVPALRALRESGAGRHITLLASTAGAAIASLLPEVDDVLSVPALPWMPGGAATPAAHEALIALLREGRFDAAVIFTVYSQNPLPAAMLCWQAGIPLSLAHCRENPYALLSDWIADPEPHELLRHEVRRQLDLVAAVGCTTTDERMSLRLRPGDVASAKAKLKRAGIDTDKPWILVHPGASAPSRRYPVDAYAEAVSEVGADAGQIAVSGNAAEAPLVAELVALIKRNGVAARDLAGVLSLGEFAAAMSSAALLIANNTGPVHIAAAVGTPVVDIYALTNPQHAPWRVPHRVLYHDVPCRFCYRSVCPQGHHACLKLLDPQRIAAAARELLHSGAEKVAISNPTVPNSRFSCTRSESMPPTTIAPLA